MVVGGQIWQENKKNEGMKKMTTYIVIAFYALLMFLIGLYSMKKADTLTAFVVGGPMVPLISQRLYLLDMRVGMAGILVSGLY